MNWFLEKIGGLVDWVIGERTTVEYTGTAAHRKVTLRPSLASDTVQIGVTITRTIFETHYERWWLASSSKSVYRVVAFAPEEIRDKLDPRLFEPVVYPLLCNTLLKRTRYPHLYALHAFLERMSPFYLSIKCEL